MNLKVDASIFKGGDNLYSGDLSDVPTRAKAMEALGVDGLFTLDSTIDPFLSLLLAAEHTERTELITGVAIAFARSPMTTAMQAWNILRLRVPASSMRIITLVSRPSKMRGGAK